MKNFEIHAYETHREPYTVTRDDVYSLRKDAKAVWLQRACFWVLGKLGAFHLDNRETVTRHRIKPQDFMDALYRQSTEVFDHMGRGGETLIIGPSDYERLMRETAPSQAFSFGANYRNERTVMGLRVQFVPWIEGFAILPPDREAGR